ncbi:aprataxin-like protein [Lutzomyia longipalpis]|uniref:Putative aprataxin-like protein biarmipes n=1 Tax=Lutzomyia longipalpis TaxID=7200 RepID=A0A1B0CB23_LUTLO|nr:aprataxin-like protein [Lutzomyia longipalpis]
MRKMSNFSHWSLNLIKDITQHPEKIILKSNLAVVIRDKYPKAKHHFLVLPLEDIEDIFQLRKNHLPLLVEMELLAKNVVEVIGGKLSDFKMGYHAQPSMKRLHLHAISDDFISPSLKTQKHWNSFNTDYFIPAPKLRQMLEDCGKIEKLPDNELKALISQPLQCNKCSYQTNTMPSLKNHLLFHEKA